MHTAFVILAVWLAANVALIAALTIYIDWWHRR